MNKESVNDSFLTDQLQKINRMTCIRFNQAMVWTHFKMFQLAHKVIEMM